MLSLDLDEINYAWAQAWNRIVYDVICVVCIDVTRIAPKLQISTPSQIWPLPAVRVAGLSWILSI